MTRDQRSVAWVAAIAGTVSACVALAVEPRSAGGELLLVALCTGVAAFVSHCVARYRVHRRRARWWT